MKNKETIMFKTIKECSDLNMLKNYKDCLRFFAEDRQLLRLNFESNSALDLLNSKIITAITERERKLSDIKQTSG